MGHGLTIFLHVARPSPAKARQSSTCFLPHGLLVPKNIPKGLPPRMGWGEEPKGDGGSGLGLYSPQPLTEDPCTENTIRTPGQPRMALDQMGGSVTWK